MTKVLHLTLYKKWFDQILCGDKKEEYRKLTHFWTKRILNKQFDEIHFKNGYSTSAPWMRVKNLGIKIGEFEGEKCYIFCLGEILETKNCETNRIKNRAIRETDHTQKKPPISNSETNGKS